MRDLTCAGILMAVTEHNCLVDKRSFEAYNVYDAVLWAFCAYKQPPAVSFTGGGCRQWKNFIERQLNNQ